MTMPQSGHFTYGKSDVVVCEDEHDLGRRAATVVAGTIRRLLTEQDVIRVTVAAGESQITFLDALARENIAWDRVIGFGIDDFHHPGIPEEFTCGYQVKKQLWSKVKPRAVHCVRPGTADAQAEAARFEDVLRDSGPIDILCQGIGTSGHLALNEPFDTRFDDPAWVRVVNIAAQSKRQLMEDPNFKALGFIPDQGITMTIPAILSSRFLYTVVPLALKRPILTRLFATAAPTTALPASVLLERNGMIFVDRNSCPAGLQTARSTQSFPAVS